VLNLNAETIVKNEDVEVDSYKKKVYIIQVLSLNQEPTFYMEGLMYIQDPISNRYIVQDVNNYLTKKDAIIVKNKWRNKGFVNSFIKVAYIFVNEVDHKDNREPVSNDNKKDDSTPNNDNKRLSEPLILPPKRLFSDYSMEFVDENYT
jgi:hypothetical protein